MRDHRVRRLPVLDGEDRVIGMLTCNDLIRRTTDTANQQPDGHAPLHLLQTLAVVGRARTTSIAALPAATPGDADRRRHAGDDRRRGVGADGVNDAAVSRR